MRKLWPLLIITIIAGILRFYDLSRMPLSPNWDEISHGYNAYSILLTGKDEWGKTLPLIFRAFGDYKLPVYIYLTAIPLLVFGLNAFAIRFVSALAGTLAIPGIYLLANAFWPNKNFSLRRINVNIGLLSAILLTLNPWHFFISRPALEANLALTLIIYGLYFLISGLRNKYLFLPASLLLGLSLHTYNTARVFVPLVIIFFIFIYIKKIIINKMVVFSGLIFLFFSGIVGLQIISGEGTARYGKLQILSNNAVFQIGERRAESNLPPMVAKIVYNRPIYFLTTVTKNYLSYFSPQFLYQTRGVQTQFAIPSRNLFTLPITIMGLIGLSFLIKNLKCLESKFILTWLFLSPIAASLTADPPQALRPNPMIPVIILISAYGILSLVTLLPKIIKQFIFIVITFSATISFAVYLHTYYTSYAIAYAPSWQYGYDSAIGYVNEHSAKYEKIFITKSAGEPHIFFAFFSKLNPGLLQPGGDNIRFKQSDWYWTDRIGKVYFVNDWNIPNMKEAKTLHLESGEDVPTNNSLLITTPMRLPSNVNLLETIYYPSGLAAFIITKIP